MRKELRFLSNAVVYVVNENEKKTEASLKDVSLHGLAIECSNYIDIEPNSSYVIAIIPEKETNIKQFRLEIESRWVKLNKVKMESGFSVMVPFNKTEFEDYLEFLAMKGKIQNMPDEAEQIEAPKAEGKADPSNDDTSSENGGKTE